ncbi:MAG TPA: hypothetical protein VEI97_01745, partial [bacterium]|nr:hypothetical protein [bacterium]
MALIKRLLLVLLALTAVAGAAVGAVLWTLLKPPPGARQFKAAFPPEDWPALDALATPAEELERYDPTGVPPAPHPALAQLAGQIRDADPDEATMRKAAEGFLIGPQGFDTPTRLEVSAIHHAAT